MSDRPDKWERLKNYAAQERDAFGNSVCKDRWDKGYYRAMDAICEWISQLEFEEEDFKKGLAKGEL